MKKIIKGICLSFITLCILLMSFVVYGFYTLPDEFYSLSREEVDVGFYSCSLSESVSPAESVSSSGRYKLNISLFNKVPVKTSSLTVSDRRYVVPSGEIIGLRIFAEGVMIVGIEAVDSSKGKISPAQAAGLKTGDVICELDGEKIESSVQVDGIISSGSGRRLRVTYSRDGARRETSISPVYCVREQRYKTGMWIRDSAAGIGTMTFYDKGTGFFACLGHAVCDVDTGEILPLSDGDIVEASINGCIRGRNGTAGELCGSFKSKSLGKLIHNTDCGAFGYLDECESNGRELPVALKGEIHLGAAEIISTVEGEQPLYYSVEIERLSPDNKDDKNLTIKIEDERLIEKTGGIVQGMSGSPIIQDGKLVGAVTHVFLNDPTRGYGIFIENMLDMAG